jgi:hypothetical protein
MSTSVETGKFRVVRSIDLKDSDLQTIRKLLNIDDKIPLKPGRFMFVQPEPQDTVPGGV